MLIGLAIRGIRNILSYEYHRIDHGIMWDTFALGVPELAVSSDSKRWTLTGDVFGTGIDRHAAAHAWPRRTPADTNLQGGATRSTPCWTENRTGSTENRTGHRPGHGVAGGRDAQGGDVVCRQIEQG